MKDKIIHRLFKYLNERGIPPTRFEKLSGLSNGYLGTQLKREADLGESIINKIVGNCLDVSLVWLLTGEGPMLQGEKDNLPSGDSPESKVYYSMYKEKDQEVGVLKEEIGALKARIRQLEAEYNTERCVPDVSIKKSSI